MKLIRTHKSSQVPVKREAEQAGFTIVELMIATVVLSTILLLATVMMIGIGRLYYKGVNQSRVQDDARSITDQVAQDLKLNKITGDSLPITTAPPFLYNGALVTIQAYCIAHVRYSFIVGYKLGSGNDVRGTPNVPHVLWRDNGYDHDSSDLVGGVPVDAACPPIDVTKQLPLGHDPSGVELMAPNSRLTSFKVTGSPITSYVVTVGVAFGDDDLLCDSGFLNDCINPAPSTHIWDTSSPTGSVLCKGQAGDQFCATANLTTTVVQR